MSDPDGDPDAEELLSVDVELAESTGDASFLRAVAAASVRGAQVEQLSRAGTMLGGYRVGERIGSGGMGIVYRAEDAQGRAVALKVLRRKDEDGAGADSRRRFLREAESALQVRHPNVARVFEIGEHDGEAFIAMELLRGESLRARLARGPLEVREAARLALQIAEGVAAAHAAGIVHRDLKPDNVMIAPDGTAKLLDFGLARWIATEARPSERSVLTVEGGILGTCGYMSPEQAGGKQVDARTDVFSFGVILFEMLAGRRPFLGETNVDVFIATCSDPVPDLVALRPEVPARLAALVVELLGKLPADRPLDLARVIGLLRDLTRA